jgi:hypothetical protein
MPDAGEPGTTSNSTVCPAGSEVNDAPHRRPTPGRSYSKHLSLRRRRNWHHRSERVAMGVGPSPLNKGG